MLKSSLLMMLQINETPAVSGENWPEFRGPTGDGHADAAVLPRRIDADRVKWQLDVNGKGWSSPVIWKDQIWLTTATEDGREMSVLCVDLKT